MTLFTDSDFDEYLLDHNISIQILTTNKELNTIKTMMKSESSKEYTFILPKLSNLNKTSWIITIKSLDNNEITSYVHLVKKDNNLIINFCYTFNKYRKQGYMKILLQIAEFIIAVKLNCEYILAATYDSSYSRMLFDKMNYKCDNTNGIYFTKLKITG